MEIKNNLPKINTPANILQLLAKKLGEDVVEIVNSAGDGEWKPRSFPSGAAQLNYISRTLQTTVEDSGVRLSWGAGLPYGWIHELGGTIQHPGVQKSPIPIRTDGGIIFRWMKNPFVITMPKRSVKERLDTRIDEYTELVGRNITIERNDKEE